MEITFIPYVGSAVSALGKMLDPSILVVSSGSEADSHILQMAEGLKSTHRIFTFEDGMQGQCMPKGDVDSQSVDDLRKAIEGVAGKSTLMGIFTSDHCLAHKAMELCAAWPGQTMPEA